MVMNQDEEAYQKLVRYVGNVVILLEAEECREWVAVGWNASVV